LQLSAFSIQQTAAISLEQKPVAYMVLCYHTTTIISSTLAKWQRDTDIMVEENCNIKQHIILDSTCKMTELSHGKRSLLSYSFVSSFFPFFGGRGVAKC